MTFNESQVSRIADYVMEKMANPDIELEASGRHVHLTRSAVDTLFGSGYQLKFKATLSQPGQFACEERVRVVGEKGAFSAVAILGPERSEVQVEISQTDATVLGVSAPVRLSGDIEGTQGVLLVGPQGKLRIGKGVIVAQRHIHMTPDFAERHGFRDKQTVSVLVDGARSVTFHAVIVRVSPSFANYMHIDYDEANACGFTRGLIGRIGGEGRFGFR